MRGDKDISKLNLRVVVKQWDSTQDAGAGSYYTELNSWERWANKYNRSGSQFNSESQQQWQYDTTFVLRYDAQFQSNMTIDHAGQRWLINSIEIDEEGYKGLMKCRCSTTDIAINIS